MKFDIFGAFRKSVGKKYKFYYNLTRPSGTLHEDRYTFCIVSHSIVLSTRNFTDRIVRKIKTHILFLVTVHLEAQILFNVFIHL